MCVAQCVAALILVHSLVVLAVSCNFYINVSTNLKNMFDEVV